MMSPLLCLSICPLLPFIEPQRPYDHARRTRTFTTLEVINTHAHSQASTHTHTNCTHKCLLHLFVCLCFLHSLLAPTWDSKHYCKPHLTVVVTDSTPQDRSERLPGVPLQLNLGRAWPGFSLGSLAHLWLGYAVLLATNTYLPFCLFYDSPIHKRTKINTFEHILSFFDRWRQTMMFYNKHNMTRSTQIFS